VKKWQEIEFLDFKERQIRRRTQKSRAIQLEAEINAPQQSGLRFVAVFAVLIVVLGVGGVTYVHHRDEARGVELAKRTELAVGELKGEVQFSTATAPFAPLKTGDRMAEAFTITMPARGRAVLSTSLAGSRIVVMEKANVELQRPQVHEGEPLDRLYLTALLKQGTVMCEFRKGEPRFEIKLPQSVTVRCGNGLYKVVVEENGTATVLVREGRVKVIGSDKKEALVKVDERAVISATGECAKPANFPTPETVWR